MLVVKKKREILGVGGSQVFIFIGIGKIVCLELLSVASQQHNHFTQPRDEKEKKSIPQHPSILATSPYLRHSGIQ